VPTAVAPSFSVVVPLYNKADAVARTICSVLAQTELPEALIVVDDGSTDGSVAAVERAMAQAPDTIEFRLIRQENAGVSVARNRGAAEAHSRFIAFLDADDEWSPNYLVELSRLAVACPAAGVLSVRNAKVGADGRAVPEPSALPEHFFGVVEHPLEAYRRGYGLFHSSSVAIRSDAWQRCGGFPPGAQAGEDIYLWLKLCLDETVAHSATSLSIWHDEDSGFALRSGSTPFHFRYFLGTVEGRCLLGRADLVGFLASNLLVQIAAQRLFGNAEVVAELRDLSRALPWPDRIKCWSASFAPHWSLRSMAYLRRRSRGLERNY
jgi:glycosyltransferase involved in cell wall biosynthesis